MKIKYLTILVLLFSIPCIGQKNTTKPPIQYKGVGIFKAKKGDNVIILPDTAYIVTTSFFETATKAFEYVENNKCDSIQQVCNETIANQETHYQTLSKELDSCLMTQKELILTHELEIKKLQLSNDKQSSEIQTLELISDKQKQANKAKIKKVRWRNLTIGALITEAIRRIYQYIIP